MILTHHVPNVSKSGEERRRPMLVFLPDELAGRVTIDLWNELLPRTAHTDSARGIVAFVSGCTWRHVTYGWTFLFDSFDVTSGNHTDYSYIDISWPPRKL